MLSFLEREGAVGFAINGKGYVGLGYSDSLITYLRDFYEYDAESDKWRQIEDFPGSARNKAVAFVIEQKTYVGLGITSNKIDDDFYVYDPALERWTLGTKFPAEPRITSETFSVNKSGFLISGNTCYYEHNDEIFNDVWKFDAGNSTWKYLLIILLKNEYKPYLEI